jgi:hypothetical protein
VSAKHGETNANVVRRRMWPGGPLRNWSPTQASAASMLYAKGGYVGGYVCDLCQRTSPGAYHARGLWLCGGCKDGRKNPIEGPRRVP